LNPHGKLLSIAIYLHQFEGDLNPNPKGIMPFVAQALLHPTMNSKTNSNLQSV
jgi:hypothetical protein